MVFQQSGKVLKCQAPQRVLSLTGVPIPGLYTPALKIKPTSPFTGNRFLGGLGNCASGLACYSFSCLSEARGNGWQHNSSLSVHFSQGDVSKPSCSPQGGHHGHNHFYPSIACEPPSLIGTWTMGNLWMAASLEKKSHPLPAVVNYLYSLVINQRTLSVRWPVSGVGSLISV